MASISTHLIPQVGAKRYREMRAAGETPLPKATYLDSAEDFDIPSRDSGRSIPCRILRPENDKPIKTVFLHIHGGGWVLQDQKSQDPALQDIANSTGALCFSVGYRLAPEDPFPAGPNDCYDAAEWLVDNAESKFGAPLGFVGGESAGGHLGMLVALHLLQHSTQKYADFRFKGLLLHFGCYSMIWTPQVYNFQKPEILVLDRDLMDHYIEVFLPGKTDAEKRHPSISPLYANLEPLEGEVAACTVYLWYGGLLIRRYYVYECEVVNGRRTSSRQDRTRRAAWLHHVSEKHERKWSRGRDEGC